ncbi:MAG: hypothetical protein Q7J24_15055 [Desulfomicrobium sp.]|nr:hypothetical protein [Desulfomicrobium sp.]
MNIVLKIVLTLVMMLVWAIGKEVAQKAQGSGFGFMTLIVSVVCTWVILDTWFGFWLFSKKKNESDNSIQSDPVKESYLSNVNNVSQKSSEAKYDMPIQTLKTVPEIHNEVNMNSAEYSETINEDELYLQATNEVNEGNQDQALWAKCMALCEGDENKARYKYIKERVDRLRDVMAREIEEKRKEDRIRSEMLQNEIERKIQESADFKIEKLLRQEISSYLLPHNFNTFKSMLKENLCNIFISKAENVSYVSQNGTLFTFDTKNDFIEYCLQNKNDFKRYVNLENIN